MTDKDTAATRSVLLFEEMQDAVAEASEPLRGLRSRIQSAMDIVDVEPFVWVDAAQCAADVFGRPGLAKDIYRLSPHHDKEGEVWRDEEEDHG